jgi:hypothetical protein
MEWRPKSSRAYAFDSTGKGLAQRFKSAGAVTETAADFYVAGLAGSPGVGVEILDTLVPGALADLIARPGTATGSVTTGWQNQAAGAAAFGEISDENAATWHRNTATLKNGQPIIEEWRIGTDPTAATDRITAVSVQSDLGSTDRTLQARHILNIGGVRYFGAYFYMGNVNGYPGVFTTRWFYNPATLLPWTRADVTAFGTGTDEFGIEVQPTSGVAAAASVIHKELRLIVSRVTENRMGAAYSSSLALGASAPRWQERGLTSIKGALTATTWYYFHILNWLNANAGNFWTTSILKDSSVNTLGGVQEATSAASTTGEHRKVYETTLGYGATITAANAQVGEMFGMILDRAGTIETQSQPYVFNDTPGLLVNDNEQGITTAAATTYGGLVVPGRWQSPLGTDGTVTVEVRHGAGADTGGGTLDIGPFPVDVSSWGVDLADRIILFPAPFAFLATTLYYIRFFGSGSAGRLVQLERIYDDSANVSTGVTAAELDGATQGGTTDHAAFANNFIVVNSGDMPLALLAAPAALAGFTATALAAA